jgi:TM2 domain-containing membrane protein YozV
MRLRSIFPGMAFCLLFSVFLAANILYAQSADPLLSIDNRLAFASHLVCAGDYPRAADEYHAIPFTFLNDTSRLRLACCYLHAAQDDSLYYILKQLKRPELVYELSARTIRFYFENNEFERMARFIAVKPLPGKTLYPLDEYSVDSFSDLSENNRTELNELLKNRKSPAVKSPLEAALLSAFVPGLGKLYTGKTGDGITAFIFTGLMTFLAIDNFKYDHNFRGAVFSVAGALYYAGNIYGSAVSAQIVNDEEKRLAAERLYEFVRSNGCFLNPGNALCGGIK